MKTNILSRILLLPLLAILLNACSSNLDTFNLQYSVFIDDIENPGLPIYSEWGYNTFGIYIDGIPFVSSYSSMPAKIIVHSDTMNIMLRGRTDYMIETLTLSFIGYPINDYSDLKVLNDSVLDMKGDKCIVTFTRNDIPDTLKIIEGKFYIKRIQDLYVDKQYAKSIISGTFNFKTFIEDEPVAASNGRFDVGIGYNNFFNY